MADNLLLVSILVSFLSSLLFMPGWIRKAKEIIAKVEKVLIEKPALAERKAVIELLNNAKKHLTSAEESQKEEKFGEAFGRANSSIQNAENALRLIAKTEQKETICAQEYNPVCAKVNIQCVKVPCDPIYETYSNACKASKNPMTMKAP